MRRPARARPDEDGLLRAMVTSARVISANEPLLRAMLEEQVLQATSISMALARVLADRLANSRLPAAALATEIARLHEDVPALGVHAAADIAAILERDPASDDPCLVFLFHKGYMALQCHRAAHELWKSRREALATVFQNRASEVFGVDIHAAARIGRGAFIDHATGLVIGETAVVGCNVTLFQGVTLGGTGKDIGDRHPKVDDDVTIYAGATLLGNIRVGRGVRIGAGSVVLHDVAPNMTVAGAPARPVGISSIVGGLRERTPDQACASTSNLRETAR